jgi:hypothetical protein
VPKRGKIIVYGHFLAVCALALAGCVNPSMQDAVGPLIGQNVNIVLNRWPAPSMTAPAFGGTMYSWRILNGSGDCTVNLYSTPDGVLKSWDWNGTQGGPCASLAAQLRTGIGFMDAGSLR